MTNDKPRRVATAVGFISGVFACLDALRTINFYWPPADVWDALSRPQQLELVGGIAVMVVTVIVSMVNRRET